MGHSSGPQRGRWSRALASGDRVVSVWYQGGTTLLPGRYQPGTRLVPIWYLVPGWYQAGTSLGPGTRLVPGWYQCGTSLVAIWYQSGTSLVPVWYQAGTRPQGSPTFRLYVPGTRASGVCQNPGSKCPTRGLKIILRESEGTRKFSKSGGTGTRLVPEWHQTRGSASLSPRCPWWQEPRHSPPSLRTHGWAPIAAQPRPAPDAPRRPVPFPLSIVSRFFSWVGPRRVPCVCGRRLLPLVRTRLLPSAGRVLPQ